MTTDHVRRSTPHRTDMGTPPRPTGSTPRDVVRRMESRPSLPRGRSERFRGYGVMGLPFASGHVLAMRRFPATSVGPAYRSVWHRDPAGQWTMWVDVDPAQACPRYFGSALTRTIHAPIDVSWPDPFRMTVTIDGGRHLDWTVELGATPLTRLFSAVGRLTPGFLWQRRAVLSAMAAVAGPLLGAGRLSMHGTAPNGQWFKTNPKRIWFVTAGRAVLNGTDLGAFGPLAESASLGEFRIPQRGMFAIGQAFFEPFTAERHLPVTGIQS